MVSGFPVSTFWLGLAAFVAAELAVFAVWSRGRMGLRTTATTMVLMGLAGALWAWPDLVGRVLPLPPTSPGTYAIFDVLFLITAFLAAVFWFRLDAVNRHLVSMTREFALDAVSPELTEWASAPKAGPRIAIVIAARDEQEALTGILSSIRAQPLPGEKRVILVDDGSVDWSSGIARNAGAITLRHPYSLGIGATLTTGFMASLRCRPDIVVQMDADGQHDAGELPRLIAPILEGKADLVIASRFRGRCPSSLSRTRRVGILGYTWLVNRISGYRLTDLTSGFRAVRATALPQVMFLAQRNWAIEMTIRAGRAGVRMAEVPVEDLPRQGGRSQFHDISTFFLYHPRAIGQIHRALNVKNTTNIPHLSEPPVPLAPLRPTSSTTEIPRTFPAHSTDGPPPAAGHVPSITEVAS